LIVEKHHFIQVGSSIQIQGQLDDCSAVGGAFDAMEFCELTCGQPLAVLGYWVMRQSGIIQEININAKKLIRSV
jgi:hypothetical protein